MKAYTRMARTFYKLDKKLLETRLLAMLCSNEFIKIIFRFAYVNDRIIWH